MENAIIGKPLDSQRFKQDSEPAGTALSPPQLNGASGGLDSSTTQTTGDPERLPHTLGNIAIASLDITKILNAIAPTLQMLTKEALTTVLCGRKETRESPYQPKK